MTPKFLFLAILAGILLSPAVQAAIPGRQVTQTDRTAAAAGVDPIGPPAYEGVWVLRELTLEETAQRAGLIIVGRVQSQTARRVPGGIVTDITVQVEQLRSTESRAVAPTTTFTVQGGSVGSDRLFAGGQPFFVNGERVLLFLRSATDRQLVQMYTSRYTLAGAEAVQPEGNKRLSISDVEARMTRVRQDGPPIQIGASNNQTVASAPFTTFCVPWTASQMPVPYTINDGSAGGASANGTGSATGVAQFNVVEQALAMWQVLPDSAMAFRVAGPTSKDGMSHFDSENTIAWANIDTVEGGGPGVIGLNYCSMNQSGRIDPDTLVSSSSAFTWDSFPDDGITFGTISVKAVLAHELGHGLGLGHSDAVCSGNGATTPTMCASIQMGADKFIQADDQAGAAGQYPISGAGAPGAPSGLSATQTSATSTTLNWTASSGSKFAYQVDRATPDCNATFRPLNTVAGTLTTYLDNNYGFQLPAGTIYCYRVKALGVGGDSAFSNSAMIGSGTQCSPGAVSLWANSVTPGTPAVADGGSYELGVKFRADVTGNVCGVKFYKGTGNSGTHVGRLWTTSGTQLASGTFVNETATGWQTMAFATPVPIVANTNYVVSYSAPMGHLALDANYFASQYDNGLLHAPSNAAAGGNGVWAFTAGNFPAQSGNGSNYWVDPLFVADATPSSCTGTTRTIFAQQSQPGTPFFNDPTAYTLGVKFTAEVPGIVCGVRFYKGAGNNGSHTGHLWTLQGTLLASVTFTGETASGWQQANFANPVQITAGTTYAVSYSTSSGLAFNQGQFSQNGVDNAPLHAPSSPSSGGNGLYAFGLNTFPSNSANGTNYWVDVVFQANAGLCGTTTMTVFSPASTPAIPAVADSGSYEIGVKFMSDVGGQVCGVRFYKGTGNGGTHVGRLWSSSGAQLASATFVSETGTGWQQVLFSSPVQVTANTMYIVSYSDPQGRLSLNSGQLNNSIDNAPLHLPASGAVGGNGVYAIGAGSFPGNGSAGNNYWVDLVFAPGASGGGVSDSCLAGSSSVFLTTSTPGTPSVNDGGAYEFGMKFRSDVNGVACGVRFYKGAGNNGTHVGRLWTTGGVLLSSVTFTGETASGWQQAMFGSPIALTAGTTYVVSYTTPVGHPSFDANTFNNPVDNGILHAPSGAQSSGNGLYGGAGAFPATAVNHNYWVDVLVAPTCGCSVWSNNYVPTSSAIADSSAYELGLRFKAEQNGFISGVRFYKGVGNGGTHVGKLWRADGGLLASATFTNETATGWQQVSFSTPVFVAAGGTYVVSYSAPQGHPAADINYFTKGVESGPLTVFENSAGGNGVYNGAGVFPAFSANGNNFWVDAVWIAGCLNCLKVEPPVQATAPRQTSLPPPPPGSGLPVPPMRDTAPPGSQQIRPPTGDTAPPIPPAPTPPAPTPTPTSPPPRRDGRDGP